MDNLKFCAVVNIGKRTDPYQVYPKLFSENYSDAKNLIISETREPNRTIYEVKNEYSETLYLIKHGK